MKLLLDMGLARRAGALLRERGFDCTHVGELGLPRLADRAILQMAADEGRAVVTLDADFSALLALSGASRPSVIHIRREGLDFRRAADLIARTVGLLCEDLEVGCIASVSERGVRVHHLPIRPQAR